MWINFHAEAPFAIKLFVGGINAVSGEPLTETPATLLRRLTLLSKEKSVQDYIVPPEQLWLDGIASGDGKVRQFVAMPFGTGYTVEAQITGQDVLGGLQFHVIPSNWTPSPPIPQPPPRPEPPVSVEIEKGSTADFVVSKLFIKTLTGKTVTLGPMHSSTTTYGLKGMITDKESIPADQQRMVFVGKQLQGKFPGAFAGSWGFDDDLELADERCLADYNIQSVSSFVSARSRTWAVLDNLLCRGL